MGSCPEGLSRCLQGVPWESVPNAVRVLIAHTAGIPVRMPTSPLPQRSGPPASVLRSAVDTDPGVYQKSTANTCRHKWATAPKRKRILSFSLIPFGVRCLGWSQYPVTIVLCQFNGKPNDNLLTLLTRWWANSFLCFLVEPEKASPHNALGGSLQKFCRCPVYMGFGLV